MFDFEPVAPRGIICLAELGATLATMSIQTISVHHLSGYENPAVEPVRDDICPLVTLLHSGRRKELVNALIAATDKGDRTAADTFGNLLLDEADSEFFIILRAGGCKKVMCMAPLPEIRDEFEMLAWIEDELPRQICDLKRQACAGCFA
jgi:hypothetical protein